MAIAFPPALVAAGLVLAIEYKIIEADRKIEDPPRTDFAQATAAVPVTAFRDVFGVSPLERVGALFISTLLDTVAVEEAMVLSDERAQGARIFGASSHAAMRTREMAAHARNAGLLNTNLEQLGHALSHQFASLDIDILETRARKPVEMAGLMSEHLHRAVPALLSRAGLPVEGLDVSLVDVDPSRAPFEDLSRALSEAADHAGAYGRQLLVDFPDDDPEGGPGGLPLVTPPGSGPTGGYRLMPWADSLA